MDTPGVSPRKTAILSEHDKRFLKIARPIFMVLALGPIVPIYFGVISFQVFVIYLLCVFSLDRLIAHHFLGRPD